MEDKEEIKNQEERLEFLFNIISGLDDVNVELKDFKKSGGFEDLDVPYSSIEEKKIILDTNEGYDKNKSGGLQELGHLWLSGSLKHLVQNWNSVKYGSFENFRMIVNVMEDIRTENLMSVRYPQIKNRLINLHIERLNKFLEENPFFVAKDPRVSMYLHAENRFDIPIDIDPSIKDISENLKKVIDESKFQDGNWKTMINTALKIAENIKKWEDEYFKPLQDQMNQVMKMVQDAQKESKDLAAEQYKARKGVGDIQKNRENTKSILKEFDGKLKELEDLSKNRSKEFKDKLKKHLENLKEVRDAEETQLDKYDKTTDSFMDYVKDVAEEMDKLHKDKYVPAIEKQTEIAEKIGNIKKDLKSNFEKVPKTYIHFFEDINKENVGDGSELTKEMIEAIQKDELKEEDKGEGEGNNGIPRTPPKFIRENIYFKPPPGSKVNKNEPLVKKFGISSRFAAEGHYPIPDLKLALSMGYEVSSALKRELKLKAVTLKKRLSGTVDMKAIKKQISKYGKIIDPRVMKIKRDLVEKHTVLVLTDFSGSMSGRKLQHAKQALVTLGKTLESLNVEYSLRGFSATSGRFQICDIVMKDFEEPHMDYTIINKVFYPNDGEDNCQNRDGSSIRHCTKLLQQHRGKKMMIVISDGMPHHPSDKDEYSGEFGNDDTMEAIKEAEEGGIKIMGISIDPSANHFVQQAYPNSFAFNDTKMLPIQLTRTYIKTIMGR